jgi:hypothetical protein
MTSVLNKGSSHRKVTKDAKKRYFFLSDEKAERKNFRYPSGTLAVDNTGSLGVLCVFAVNKSAFQ